MNSLSGRVESATGSFGGHHHLATCLGAAGVTGLFSKLLSGAAQREQASAGGDRCGETSTSSTCASRHTGSHQVQTGKQGILAILQESQQAQRRDKPVKATLLVSELPRPTLQSPSILSSLAWPKPPDERGHGRCPFLLCLYCQDGQPNSTWRNSHTR